MNVEREVFETRMAGFHQICRARDFRITPQRLAVFSALARTADHPSAETLHRTVRKQMPTITLDTVYRTLGTLEKVGLVLRVSVVANTQRFEANTERHHHFVCRRCGAISDIYSSKLDKLQLANELPEGHVVDWTQVELRGTCKKCTSGASAAPKRRGKKQTTSR